VSRNPNSIEARGLAGRIFSYVLLYMVLVNWKRCFFKVVDRIDNTG
jgi:hypothetical protein